MARGLGPGVGEPERKFRELLTRGVSLVQPCVALHGTSLCYLCNFSLNLKLFQTINVYERKGLGWNLAISSLGYSWNRDIPGKVKGESGTVHSDPCPSEAESGHGPAVSCATQ